MHSNEAREKRELTRNEFEEELLVAIKEKLNSPQNSKYHEYKDLVRLRCQEMAEELGDTEEMKKGLHMYFFSLLFQNPEGVRNIWRTLYDFDQEVKEKDSDESIELESGITCLLDQQIDGVTINWHLAKAMLRGDLEVIKTKFLDEDAYYFAIPSKEDKKARVNNPTRKKLTAELEEKLGTSIIPKPIPNITVPTKDFGVKEKQVFLKIYTFLQTDADILFYSPQWREQIDKYFADIHQFFEKLVADLEALVNSDKRKTKYKDFLREVIDTYLVPLREYCTQLSAYCGNNQLPADMLLEPILIENELLQDGWKESDIRAVAAKWKKHKREIKEYLADNMTVLGVPIADTPPRPIFTEEEIHEDGQWAPRHTGEIPPEFRDEADKLAVLVEEKVRDAIGAADTQELELQPALRAAGLGETAVLKALVEQEQAKSRRGISLAPTILDMPVYKDPVPPTFTELIRSGDRNRLLKLINKADGPERAELEEVLEEQIVGKFKELGKNERKDLKNPTNFNVLKAELETIVDNLVITARLRKFYFKELMEFFSSKLVSDNNLDENVFTLFSDLARKLEDNLHLPANFSQITKDLAEARFPTLGNVASAKIQIQTAHANERLWAFISHKGREQETQANEDHIVSGLLEESVISLKAINDLHERCSTELNQEEALFALISELEDSAKSAHDGVKATVKGFWSKLFLNGETKKSIKAYRKTNHKAIDEIWKKLLLPMVASYGKIMFSDEDPKIS